MKNLFVFWLFILLPFGTLCFLISNNEITVVQFACGIITYFFYRIITDGARLTALGVIERKDVWKLMIPGFRYQFFIPLYWKI